MNMKPIYGIGDKVRIIKYGHLIWNDKRWVDISPNLIGQEGLVGEVKITQGIPGYAIEGIKGKHAWYYEGQMEMVNKNPNR